MGGAARLKLLLDTHIWLWSIRESHRLRPPVREILGDPMNERWLSPISTWEALTLHRKSRIHLHVDPAAWLARAALGLRQAPITHEIARAAHQLGVSHFDPADCLIAATALVHDLTLVTADERLLQISAIKTLSNR